MACVDCVKGYVRTDKQPTGTVQNLYGLSTYVSQPSSGKHVKGIVVFVPDAFGWEFVNNRILADTYAEAGYRVYLPDFMVGASVPLYFLTSIERLTSWSSLTNIVSKPYDLFWIVVGMSPFIWHNLPAYSHQRIVSFIEKIRAAPVDEDKDLPVMAAGFCWGGKHVIMLTQQSEAHLVDGVFTAHPSALTLPLDIDNVRKPVSIAVGTKDNWLSLDQIREVKKTFGRLDKEVPGMKSEVITYDGATHGFSVRIDMENPNQVEQAQKAEQQAIDWFDGLLLS